MGQTSLQYILYIYIYIYIYTYLYIYIVFIYTYNMLYDAKFGGMKVHTFFPLERSPGHFILTKRIFEYIRGRFGRIAAEHHPVPEICRVTKVTRINAMLVARARV